MVSPRYASVPSLCVGTPRGPIEHSTESVVWGKRRRHRGAGVGIAAALALLSAAPSAVADAPAAGPSVRVIVMSAGGSAGSARANDHVQGHGRVVGELAAADSVVADVTP